jgi:hypothetical protein
MSIDVPNPFAAGRPPRAALQWATAANSNYG